MILKVKRYKSAEFGYADFVNRQTIRLIESIGYDLYLIVCFRLSKAFYLRFKIFSSNLMANYWRFLCDGLIFLKNL